MSDQQQHDVPWPRHPQRERRAAHRALGLVGLLERRPDLAGVHEPADLAAEAVRWCV